MLDIELKKIEFRQYTGYFQRPAYEETLVITRNSVTYKKEFTGPFNFDENNNPINLDVKWTYKSSRDFEWFDTIIPDIFLIKKDERGILDAGGRCFKFVFSDGKSIEFYYCGGYIKDEHLDKIRKCIRKVIPKQEGYIL